MHLVELRSGREGHPTIALVAQAMHEEIAAVHPGVPAATKFVDNRDSAPTRADDERAAHPPQARRTRSRVGAMTGRPSFEVGAALRGASLRASRGGPGRL